MRDKQNPARSGDDHTVSVLARTRTLCGQCSDGVGVDGAAVAVFASDTIRDLVYATNVTAERIDELEFTLGEGPGLAAYHSSVPESHPDLAADPAATARWPMFVPEIFDLGIHAVFAFPLDLIGARLGVLELYRARPGPLEDRQDRVAADYAAVLGPTVVDELDPTRNPSTLIDPALFPRGTVHVASGVMAVQLRVSPADALVRLRAMAFAQHRRITVLARDVIAGRLSFRPEESGDT